MVNNFQGNQSECITNNFIMGRKRFCTQPIRNYSQFNEGKNLDLHSSFNVKIALYFFLNTLN